MKGISKQTYFMETKSTVQPPRELLAPSNRVKSTSCFNAF
jgi:hypothetical protein